MALYHFSVRHVSRGKGQKVVASAAYISGQRIYDGYYNKIHDYTSKSGVVFTEILTPEYVPERMTDRETLWNEVEHQNGKVPTARWKREKEELQAVIEELKADNQPYQEELAFVKKVQSCADIARCDREMAETDTSGRSEEKREKQVKFPVFHGVQTEDILEENGKAEQQTVKQSEQKTEKKTSLLRKLDEKKKECAERDAKQQAVKKKRNHEMSL